MFALPSPLAVAVDRRLDVANARADGRQRVRDGELGVVVGVDAEGRRRAIGARDRRARRRRQDLEELRRQRAAVRVAQDERPRAAIERGAERARRVAGDWPCSRRRSARRRRRARGPRRRSAGRCRRSSRGSRSSVAPRTSVTCSSQLLPKIVTTGVSARSSSVRFGSAFGGVRAVAGRAEGGELRVRTSGGPSPPGRTRCPSGWSRASRPRRRACRTRRAGARSAACPRATA